MHPVAAYHHVKRDLKIMPRSDEIHTLIALKTREGYYAEIYQDRHWIYKAKVLFATGEAHILDVVANGMRKIWEKLQEPGCCAYVMPTTEGTRALYVGNYGLIGGVPSKSVAGLNREALQRCFDTVKFLSRSAYKAGTVKPEDMPPGFRLVHQTEAECPGNLRMIAAEEISTGKMFVLTGGTQVKPLSGANLLSDFFVALQVMDPWMDYARKFVQEVKSKTDQRPIFMFGGHSKAQAISEPMAYENNAYSLSIEGPGVRKLLAKYYGPLDESKTDKFFSFSAESIINTRFEHAGHVVKVNLTEAAWKELMAEQARLARFEKFDGIARSYPEAEFSTYEVPIMLSLGQYQLILHPLDNIANIKESEYTRLFSPEKSEPNLLKLTMEFLKNPANWTTQNSGIYPICFDTYPAFVPPPSFKFSFEIMANRPRALSHIEEYAFSLSQSFSQSEGFYHHPPGRHSYADEYIPWFEALIKILPLLEREEIKEDLDRLFRLHREMLIVITDLCIRRAQPIVFSSTLNLKRLMVEDKLKEINRILLQVCAKLPKPPQIPGLFPLQRIEKLNAEITIQDWRVLCTSQNEVYGSFHSHRGGARERTSQTFPGFFEKEAWHVGNKDNSILRRYIQFPKQFTLALKADGKPDRSISLSRPGPGGRSLSYDPVSFDIRGDKMVLCLRSLPTEFTVDDTRGQKQKHGYRCNRGIFRSNDSARIEIINLLTSATVRSLEFTSNFPRRVEFANGNEILVEYDSGKQSVIELTPRPVLLKALQVKQQESLQKLEALAKDGQWQHLQMQTDNPDSAFDYWMFPIDYPSNKYGDQYTVSSADIDALKITPLWMKNYRNGVLLVAKSWGWDLENQQDLTNSVQRWTGFEVRLQKMLRSLRLFGQDDLLQALDHFAAAIYQPEIPSPVASSSAPVSASSQIASPLPKKRKIDRSQEIE